MKKNLKLNALAAKVLSETEMNEVRGGAAGDPCVCGCKYASSGGSSTNANGGANNAGGLYSSGGGTHFENSVMCSDKVSIVELPTKELIPII